MSLETTPALARAALDDLEVEGEVVVHRLYDVGYEIDLDRAFARLADSAPERPRPVRGEAQAIQIANPPVTVTLGAESIATGTGASDARLSARIFDFGVISVRAQVPIAATRSWAQFVACGTAAANAAAWREIFPRIRTQLVQRLGDAVLRPGESPVTEDYVVFRIDRMTDAAGARLGNEVLEDAAIAALLLGETRPIAPNTRREALAQRFSFYEDDLVVITWNAALVVEPVAEDTDAQYVIEFANAQLLELRFYDSLLDRELPPMYDRIEEARHGFHIFGRRYSRLLSQLQTRVAETTELVERTENALKVTDDVFLARIYAAALEVFRGRTWRAGVDSKLAIVRDAYTMLNAESQARRTEVLEVIVVVLILIEIVLAIVRP